MFDYTRAFSRNIGWITPDEQQILRSKRIAIAGAGGVGGEHLITMARLGIENFNISDFDKFEVHNFNRQAGAFLSTVNQPKSAVMESIAKDINPDSKIKSFNEGINKYNVDDFLFDVDLYIDSLDFFALDARKLVFKKCEEYKIPYLTAAPIGMGVAFLCFMPGKMSFEEYFRFEQHSRNEQLIRFLVGLSPSLLQRDYLVIPESANFQKEIGPSMPMAVKMCAGVAGTYALKILLKRGEVLYAPKGLHFDAYKNKLKKTYLPFGNNGLLQRLKIKLATNLIKN
ncbi:MAG: ThiF family adenylyltransferase [Paraglaciecola sp.]|uniref:ThiF family adenylyltransferase n=1 Tax=Paraglaciecola sp. TaxID=1920173 RepID=UPI00326791C3